MGYTKPALRERIKKKIMASTKGGKSGQWSARKSQMLAAEYKKAGGGYTGPKKKSAKALDKWTKQEWRTEAGKKSRKTGEVYAPKKTIAALKGTKKLAAANKKKKAATKAGKQYAKHGLHKGKKR